MPYVDPQTVLSPQGNVRDLKVVYDSDPANGGWSVATMNWKSNPKLSDCAGMGHQRRAVKEIRNLMVMPHGSSCRMRSLQQSLKQPRNWRILRSETFSVDTRRWQPIRKARKKHSTG